MTPEELHDLVEAGSITVPNVESDGAANLPVAEPVTGAVDVHPAVAPTPSALDAALSYLRASISVIPIKADGTKQPVGKWKPYQTTRLTETDAARRFDGEVGVAIVTGKVSELEVIDFDKPEMFDRWRTLVEQQDPDALKQVAIVETPRGDGARHVHMHWPTPHGNQKLAQRWARDAAGNLLLDSKGKPRSETLIETRGEGGYVLAPGCPPQCHETGRTYRHIEGPSIEEVRAAPPLTDERHELLVNIAKSLTEIASDEVDKRALSERKRSSSNELRPGDDFNQRATWPGILEPHDWTLVSGDGAGYSKWRRPGKDSGSASATTGFCSTPASGDLLRVFSSNAGLDAGAHSKFAVYTALEHNGDFKAAAKALRERGYGSSPPSKGHAQSSDKPEDSGPKVFLIAGELPSAAEQTERLLREADLKAPVVYQRQGKLVRTLRLEHTEKGRVKVESGAIVIREVDEPFLLDRAARVAIFYRFNEQGEGTRCHPSQDLARAILSHAGNWPFARLVGVVEAPQLFSDGRVLSEEGFDYPTGLLLNTRGVSFPAITGEISKDRAKRALDWMDAQLLAGFAFVADQDRSAALAMVLSAVGRSAYGQGPAFGATAPNRACGKTTLLSLPARLATGRGPVVIAPGASEEEADKRMLSILQDGHRFVSFENLESADALDTPSIAKAITEPIYTGRPLGKTGTLSLPTDGTLWTYSGVNLIPRGDTVSRTLLIRLDPEVERPWAQQWRSTNPIEVIDAQRGMLYAAALTVLKAFIEAGCPDQGLGPCRFPEWARLVRNVLVWLGRADPMAGMLELESGDPENEPLADLMEVWARVIGDRVVTVAEVIATSREHGALREAIRGVAASDRRTDELEPRKLGRFLRRHERRVVRGQRFMRAEDTGTRARWALRKVGGDQGGAVFAVSAVSPTPIHANAQVSTETRGYADARTHTREGAREHVCEPGETNCNNCGNCETVDAATGEIVTQATDDVGSVA